MGKSLWMKRYSFAVLSLLSFSCAEKMQPDPAFRNVIVIVADDHTKKAMGNHPLINTPNLDRLASESLVFKRAYCNSPICSPSRQSMLTGKYPHATGVTLLFTPFADGPNTTVAEHLKGFGFATALYGKSHFNEWIWNGLYQNSPPTYGFDEIFDNNDIRQSDRVKKSLPDSIKTNNSYSPGTSHSIWNTSYLPSPCFDEDCEGTILAKRAVDYLRKNKDYRFLLWLAFYEPHAPFSFPVEYANSVSPAQVVLPATSAEDDRWEPEIFRNLVDEERKGAIAAYLTSTMYLDKNIGLVLDALPKLGLVENTLIVYASDNGYLLYDHKRLEKHTMWEQAVSVPLFVKGKGIRPRESEKLVEYVDIVPSILDALQIPPLTEVQGKSFYPMASGKDEETKDIVFSEYLEDNMAMVAGEKWKYVFHTGKRDLGLEYKTGFGAPGISHLLYDLENDPREAKNVADENPEKVLELQKIMLSRFLETHPQAQMLPEELSLIGKLVWFCEPGDVGAEYGGKPLRVIQKQ